MQILRSGHEIGREVAIMGGGTAKIIVGAVLISGGILASCFAFVLGSIGGFASEDAGQFVFAVLAGLAMAVLGIVLCVYGIKESLKQEKQEKKDGVPEVRSSNEWVCRNCGCQNKQGLDKCIWCGADVK
jgi:hypothetical protein